MRKRVKYTSLLPIYFVVLALFLLLAFGGSKAVTVLSVNAPIADRKTVIIDPGHGGEDGGATSCTGILESQYNLEISLRLRDLFHLLGVNTLMIRETDCSVYTAGDTIAQKKISDLKERVRMVNNTPDALLISIHQNHFVQSQYSGAQMFFAPTDGSKELAQLLQKAFIETVNPNSHRQVKKADGIYLMQHINCPAVLIECGFLSNPTEAYLLGSEDYQKKLCAIIACTTTDALFST